MGYRSEVKLLFTGEPDELRAFIAKTKLEMGEEAFTWADSSDIQPKHWLLEWNSVKWYDSYEEVQAWEALYQSTDEDGCPIGAEFMRVGEGDDDIEHRMTHDDDRSFWVSRTIEVDI